MGVRKAMGNMASSLSTWGLRHLAHRPAANMPGKIALKIDPRIIAESMDKITEGSIVVVGTNGKTTITNMIADALERQGKSIACNRTGANLAYGVATTLLQTKGTVEWGVFESDELWLAHTLPQVQADYVLLLNLFRDQLDRCGEIDRVQDAIATALEQSPNTTLLYNADDPLCTIIAQRVSNKSVAFGVGEDMHQRQNVVADAQMCQRCSAMFTYGYRQYGQLGTYSCPNCGFSRPDLDFAAKSVVFGGEITFSVEETETGKSVDLHAQRAGSYMVYNVMAAWLASHCAGVSDAVFQKAVDLFDPQNGRLQSLTIEGRPVLLNLAKNPTGFNQNMKLITQAPGKKVAAFFINDNEADGRDISWIWDCDFEELASQEDVMVFAGGIRKNDLQLRLKYAGIDARIVDSVNEVVDAALKLPSEWNIYAIANYTSLPAVRSALMARADKAVPANPTSGDAKPECSKKWVSGAYVHQAEAAKFDEQPLHIVHLFPDLLNLYGDGGNVRVLAQRCAWRGIPVQVEAVHYGESVDLTSADIVFLGGGPDREQKLASEVLLGMREELRTYVEGDGALLAICGGYQILGSNWLMGDESVEGLSILDLKTVRAGAGFDRLIENIALESELSPQPVVGYENHAGRTKLGASLKPFGKVVSNVGHGNDDDSGCDGALYRNCIGTYLHGPLLGKNPAIADHLIAAAMERRLGSKVELVALEDEAELAANAYMAKRLGVPGS